jgi:virginiamycin B lyase
MRAFAARTFVLPLVFSVGAFSISAVGSGQSKKSGTAAKLGVQTPGIQIAMTELKPEADIELPGPAELLTSADAVYAASPEKGALVRVDVKGNKTEAIEGVAKPCGAILSAFASLWTADCQEKAMVRIDAKTNKVKAKVPVAVGVSGSVLAASEDSVWALTDTKSTLVRIDPETNQPVADVRLPEGCTSVAFGEGAVWVTCPKQDKLLKINPRTSLVEKRIEIAGKPMGVALGEGSVWVLGSKEGKVSRVDPKTDKVTATVEMNIPDLKGSIAFGEGYVWVSAAGFPITRIDPATDKVVQQFTGGSGGAIVASNGAVWLADPSAKTLKRIDVKRIKATLAP